MCSWIINNKKTKDHWLEVEDPEGWYSAVVKWDGCVHYCRIHNTPPITNEANQHLDYIHFCDLDEEIKRLQKLLEIAKQFFGEDWI